MLLFLVFYAMASLVLLGKALGMGLGFLPMFLQHLAPCPCHTATEQRGVVLVVGTTLHQIPHDVRF